MRRRSVLPGFGLSLGITVAYLTVIIILPIAGLAIRSAGIGWEQLWRNVTSPAATASFSLTLRAALFAAMVNSVLGFICAWVLVRYRFPLRGFFDVIVDLPFALPGAVGGLALSALFATNGWIGSVFDPMGIRIAYTHLGVYVTFVFVGLPFVIRSVQPVLQNMEDAQEEAAEVLGARPFQVFMRVVLPATAPATASGATLAFARALGDYGTVIFVAGNVPLRSEVASRLVYNRLDQYDTVGAIAVATVMLASSFVMLLAINALQARASRRGRA